jgi:lipoic acid synthetase
MDDTTYLKKPEWIKVRLPAGNEWKKVDGILSKHGLHTVCDEARCPNKGECWGCGTATFMILGDECTRNCRFCAVATSKTGKPVREDEPEALAGAVAEMGLHYAVLTSVDRDDLADKGSGHFAACIRAIRLANPSIKIEILIPDYFGEDLAIVAAAGPDVLAHNIETVRRLQRTRDAKSGYESSLRTLREAKQAGIRITKSSILLGLGETKEELLEAYADLRSAGVDILVMGQYLRPTPNQIPVHEYIHPDTFRLYARDAEEAGFSSVIASPFARTSYHALEAWSIGKASGEERLKP